MATDFRNPRALGLTLAFIAVVVTVGAIIGINAAPDEWYMALAKAPWNPPNWIFAPVWFLLYVLIGVAGARAYLRNPAGVPMLLWTLQMVLNWAWTPTWFRLHLIWPAFVIIMTILLLIVTFIIRTWREDRVAAWLFVPYAAWVAFASTLNFSIGLLN